MSYKIFLDMDGVLVAMVDGALKSLGVTNYKIPPGEYDIFKWPGVNVTKKEFWHAIDQTNEDFWAELNKYSWADELVKLCENYGEVFILTSPSRNPYCLAGKMMWLQKNYNRLQRKVILTPHKYLLAAPNRILIDDSDHKINPFVEHGGIGLLFPQPWNTNYKDCEVDKIQYVREFLDKVIAK